MKSKLNSANWEIQKICGKWEKGAKIYGNWKNRQKNLGNWENKTPVSPPSLVETHKVKRTARTKETKVHQHNILKIKKNGQI